MPVFCLSFHARYGCANSGACCTSGWAIPVEAPLRARIEQALASGRLSLPGDVRSPFLEPFESAADGVSPGAGESATPEGAATILASHGSGSCSCYDREGRRCALHAQLGHDALPVACQHFPRICLIDRDGAFVTLSHYCPTAARLLLTAGAGRPSSPSPAPDNPDGCPAPGDRPLAIVEAPASFARFALEGLDARDALPPLLHPRVLADRQSYRRWERLVVELLGNGTTPEAALERVIDATEQVRRWEPGKGALAEVIDEAGISIALGRGPRPSTLPDASLALDALVRCSVPRGLAAPAAPADCTRRYDELVAAAWPRFASPILRYLAAKAFANWCAYQGRGLRTITCSLVAALSVLRVEAARHCAAAGRALDEALLVEAFRAADLLLVHLASREELARRLSEIEEANAEEMRDAL